VIRMASRNSDTDRHFENLNNLKKKRGKLRPERLSVSLYKSDGIVNVERCPNYYLHFINLR